MKRGVLGAWGVSWLGQQHRSGWAAVVALTVGLACESGGGGPDGVGSTGTGGKGSALGGTNSSTGGRGDAIGGQAPGAGGTGTGASVGSGGRPDEPGGESGVGGAVSSSGGEFSGLGGTFFEHGSRLVIPHEEQLIRLMMSPDLTTTPSPNDLGTGLIRIVAGDGYDSEHEFQISIPYLFDDEHCEGNGALYGAFEVDSIDVTEDLDNTGAHLTLEREGDTYRLKHDGLGQHDLDVKGRFVAQGSSICPALLDENGELPLGFHTEVQVEAAASARVTFDDACDSSPKVLSGQRFLPLRVELEDQAGQPYLPMNVTYSSPIDIIVETEREAEIEPPAGGFGSYGVAIVGESQLVRVSTPLGTLAIYELLAPADVDGWELQYWSEENVLGVFRTDIESGMTYPQSDLSSNAVGVTARLLAEGEPLCSQIPFADFMVTSSTTNVCTATSGDPEGHLATMVQPTGKCALRLDYPGAQGGEGLSADFSLTVTE